MKGMNLKKDKGAVTIVEAMFVFPIMFFVLFFLLFYCNACYINSNVTSQVSRYAITTAARIADPMLATLEETGSLPTSAKNLKNYPYRYVSSGFGNSTAGTAKTNLKKDIGITGFFSGMEPKIRKLDVKYNNYILYQTVKVSVDYDIVVPIKIIFTDEPTVISFSVVDEAPVDDSSEFVRNINMVWNYAQRAGIEEKINKLKEKVDELKSKVSGLFN